MIQQIYSYDKIVKYYNNNHYIRGFDKNNKTIRPITSYHPFFPVSFYNMWELSNRLNINFKKSQHIILVLEVYDCVGWFESLLVFKERKNLLKNDTFEVLCTNVSHYILEKIKYIFDFKITHVSNCKHMDDYIEKLIIQYDLKSPVQRNLIILSHKYLDVKMSKNIVYITSEKNKKLNECKVNISNYIFYSNHKIKDVRITDPIVWCKTYNLDIVFPHAVDEICCHSYEFDCKTTSCFIIPMYNAKLIKKFTKLKRKLNIAKRSIDTKEQNTGNNRYWKDWNLHTNHVDLLKNLKIVLRNKFAIYPVTNAWTKLYEILIEYPRLTDFKKINSFHICEAPGAFIAAMSYFCEKKHIELNFAAQTLNPALYNKDALNDMYGLIKKYPNKWLFGKDGTGNIINKDNIKYYEKNFKNINFITADGGVNIPTNMFLEQEAYVSKLMYSIISTVLFVLQKDGHAVLKMFIPFAEPMTISLLYLLTVNFKKVIIHKPCTSHPSSSEVYVICFDYYKHMKKTEKTKLLNMVDIKDNFHKYSIFPLNGIPDEFINTLYKMTKKLVDSQIKSINRSFTYYIHGIPDLHETKMKFVEEWININMRKKE